LVLISILCSAICPKMFFHFLDRGTAHVFAYILSNQIENGFGSLSEWTTLMCEHVL